MNQQLTTLVALQKATQTTSAMSFLGSTATVDGTTTKLTNGAASWSFAVDKTVDRDHQHQELERALAYSGSYPLTPGAQNFNWDGRAITASSGRTATTR
jgi:flagellar basal-body rod modification protein FlgD